MNNCGCKIVYLIRQGKFNITRYSIIFFRIKQKDLGNYSAAFSIIIVVFGIIIGAEFHNDKALDEVHYP